MVRKESNELRRYETYTGLEHVPSVAKFLENPDIEVLGVHISPHIKTYRIVGLKIADSTTGIIVKKEDIQLVKEFLKNGVKIDKDTRIVINNNIRVVRGVFTQAEKASRAKKS